MKKTAILILMAMLAMPIVVNAGGIGIYTPYSLGLKADRTIMPEEGEEFDTDYKLKQKAEIGISYDSNLGTDDLFSYRLGLEILHPEDELGGEEVDKYNIVNTFTFGLIRTPSMRIWIGPRINIAYENDDFDGVSYSAIEVAIAPAIGANFNLGDSFTIAFDVDYKYGYNFGLYDEEYGEGGTFVGTEKGVTYRLGVYYRFGEHFN